MRRLVVSEWLSLDGVFDAGTMAAWFNSYDSPERQAHIRNDVLGSDALLFGRATYEVLAPYWSQRHNNEMGLAAHLNSTPKYVASATPYQPDWHNTTVLRGDVIAAVRQLKEQSSEQIQVQGSPILVAALLAAGPVDQLRLLILPVLGAPGPRFFSDSYACVPRNHTTYSYRIIEWLWLARRGL